MGLLLNRLPCTGSQPHDGLRTAQVDEEERPLPCESQFPRTHVNRTEITNSLCAFELIVALLMSVSADVA